MAQGLLKPFVFAFVISLVGCFYGLRTTGGTQGVGRATTQAMVAASVLIFILTYFITKIFVWPGVGLMAGIAGPRFCASRTSRVAFDGVPALADVSFEACEGESRVILGAAGQRQDRAAEDRAGPGAARFRQGLRLRPGSHRHARARAVRHPQPGSACCSRRAPCSIR